MAEDMFERAREAFFGTAKTLPQSEPVEVPPQNRGDSALEAVLNAPQIREVPITKHLNEDIQDLGVTPTYRSIFQANSSRSQFRGP
jgi:hypothetical protein